MPGEVSGGPSSLFRWGTAGEKAPRRCSTLLADERSTHQQPDFFRIGLARRSRGRKPAAGDHAEAIANLEQFVELFRNDQHGDAFVAQIDQRLSDLRGG